MEETKGVEAVREKPLSKMELRRIEQHDNRVRRVMNERNIDREEAEKVIAAEDYENQPIAKRVKKLETVVGSVISQIQSFEGSVISRIRAFEGAVSDVYENQKLTADVFDLNFRGIGRALVGLGVTLERQVEILREVQAELQAEKDGDAKAGEGKAVVEG